MRAVVSSVGGDVPGGDAAGRQPLVRRDGLILRLLHGDEECGIGEASPLPGYSSESLASARADLVAWQVPALDPGGAPMALLEHAGAGVRSPSARFAVETAVLDWLGRRAGRPIHRILGAAGEARALPLGHLVPVAGAAEHAAALRGRGVRHLKLKVGADLDTELDALRAVRAAVPDAEIRLDANGRLPPADVASLCSAYAVVGVVLIEEPCAPEALAELPRLAVAVGLDESLGQPDAARIASAVARVQSLAAVVLKPTTLGGIARCLALAALGRTLGARPIVTHAFDGPVAMAAAAELVLALPDARIAGLAPHACLRAYPRWRGAALDDLAVTSREAPGLGLREVA